MHLPQVPKLLPFSGEQGASPGSLSLSSLWVRTMPLFLVLALPSHLGELLAICLLLPFLGLMGGPSGPIVSLSSGDGSGWSCASEGGLGWPVCTERSQWKGLGQGPDPCRGQGAPGMVTLLPWEQPHTLLI